MSAKVAATFYYDIISPFAYLYVKQRHRLESQLDITPVPILLGGLLRASDNRGPGEIAAKRPHTYQFCVWQAEKLGIPFRFPEHHPFMTVAPQRLLVEQKADWTMLEKAFDYIWMEGKDPNLSYQFCVWQAEKLGIPFRFPEHHPFMTVAPQRLLVEQKADWQMIEKAFDYIWMEGKDPNLSWSEFCSYLGLAPDTPKPESAAVKQQLIANTQQAKQDGAFGVPALIVNQHCFWGVDTIDWTLDYLSRPNMFEEASYAYAAKVPNGLA